LGLLILREPRKATEICGIADMLLRGHRENDECQFAVESSPRLDASELHLRLRAFIDEATILEVAVGAGAAVCRFRPTAIDGLVIRGVLRTGAEHLAAAGESS